MYVDLESYTHLVPCWYIFWFHLYFRFFDFVPTPNGRIVYKSSTQRAALAARCPRARKIGVYHVIYVVTWSGQIIIIIVDEAHDLVQLAI